MFARSAFRAAAPMKQQFRRYATEGPSGQQPKHNSSGGGNHTLWYVGGALALGGAAYYYFEGMPGAKKAEAKVKAAAAAAAGSPPKKALTGGEQDFVSLKLEDSQVLNHNTKLLRFALPEKDMVSGVYYTSCVLTKFFPPGKDKPVVRPYTPTNDEAAKGYMEFIIKRYEGGPMSTHLTDLKPGETLDIKGPIPKYPWTANKHPQVAMIAGGTGITPMYQLCRAIFNNPDDRTKVTLVFGNIAEEDILLRKELAHLENTYPQRFRVFYLLDKPPASGWSGRTGYVTKELLKTVLPEPKEENIKLFVCGPPGLMNSVSGNKKSPVDQGELTGMLKDMGYSLDQVFKF